MIASLVGMLSWGYPMLVVSSIVSLYPFQQKLCLCIITLGEVSLIIPLLCSHYGSVSPGSRKGERGLQEAIPARRLGARGLVRPGRKS